MDTTTTPTPTLAVVEAAATVDTVEDSATPEPAEITPAPDVAPTTEATPTSPGSASTGDGVPADEPGTWERIEASADRLEDRLEAIIRDQRARRIVVRDADRIIADFPLAVGVVGAVLAAPVAAIAAIVALVNDCTIEVEHMSPTGTVTASSPTSDEPMVVSSPSAVAEPLTVS